MKEGVLVVVALASLGLIGWASYNQGRDARHEERKIECRDFAAMTHRFCEDSPETCDQRARMTLEICLEESP